MIAKPNEVYFELLIPQQQQAVDKSTVRLTVPMCVQKQI